MEGRRASRTRPRNSPMEARSSSQKSPSKKSPDRKAPVKPSTPIRKSPARIASPGRRKSPARKSPARRSPARKSPARKSPPKRTRQKVLPMVMLNTNIVQPSAPAKELREKNEEKISNRSPIKTKTINLKASPDKKDLKASTSVHSVLTAYSSSTMTTTATVDTIDIGTTKAEDTSGDSEIAKLTSLASFVRRSVSLAKNLTPAPTATTEHSRSVSRSVYEDDYSKTEYSDNEHEEQFESFQKTDHASRNSYARMAKISREVPAPKEFGAIFVCLLLILIPAITYYLQWTCRKKSCDFKRFDFVLPSTEHIKGIFTPEKVGAYIAFTLTIFTFSAFPLGRIVKLYNNRGTVEYYFNTLAVAFLITFGFAVGQYLGYPIADLILKHYLSLYVFCVLNAFIVSFWCYIRSKYISQNLWNPYAKSGIAPIDFAIGREINPKWFRIVDVKLVSYRTSLILTLLFAEVFLYNNFKVPKVAAQYAKDLDRNGTTFSYVMTAKYLYDNTKFDSTSLLLSILLFVYAFDWIYFEHHLAASFELQQEGVGALLLLRYAVTPFLLSAIPKYFLENQGVVLPWWAIVTISLLFMVGLILKRMSNSIKYRYRMNPHNMGLAYIDTVPTFQGRRLILGGLWGRLRQPNYTGDILSLISFAIPLYWKFSWAPLICIFLIVFNLFHRAVRVNKRNFARYDSAWTRYCSRVRYLIIPKVF